MKKRAPDSVPLQSVSCPLERRTTHRYVALSLCIFQIEFLTIVNPLKYVPEVTGAFLYEGSCSRDGCNACQNLKFEKKYH